MANPDHVKKLKETKVDQKYDLREADLRRTDLREAWLWGSDLSEANLGASDLSGAKLQEANLSKAHLSGANLSGANLSKANLSDATLLRANLREANLSEANLRGAILCDFYRGHGDEIKWISDKRLWDRLGQVNLSRANLSRADLSFANLTKAVLQNANLSKADVQMANLRGVDLSGADLSEANLKMANLENANLSGANLSGANLDRTRLHGATLPEGYTQQAKNAIAQPKIRPAKNLKSISFLLYAGIIMALVVQFAHANAWTLPLFKSYGDAFATSFFITAIGIAHTAYIWRNNYLSLGLFLTTIGSFAWKYKWILPIFKTYQIPLYIGIFLILYGVFPQFLGIPLLIGGSLLLIVELGLMFTGGLAAIHLGNLLASVVLIGLSALMFRRQKKLGKTGIFQSRKA